MNRSFLPALFFLTVLPVFAAPITWETATVTGPADVSLNGTLVGALHVGGLNSTQTVNGVTFGPDPGGAGTIPLGTATVAFSFDDSFNNDFWSISTGPGGNAAYGTALDFGRSSNSLAPSGTVTLGGLVTGRTYQVQLWIVDTRDCCNTRNRTVTAGNTANTSASTGPNIVLGTFTANAATQLITISSAPATFGPQVNLLQLRELGTIVTTADDEDDGSLGGGAGISLREAVKYSPSGSLITFAPALDGGTILFTGGNMNVPGALTIDASSLPHGLTLDADHLSRHFYDDQSAQPFALTGLTLVNGNGTGINSPRGGVIYSINAPLRLTRCTLKDNSATNGGAIFTQASTLLDHCTLTGNRSTEGSSTGAITHILSGQLTLTHCTISGNTGNGFGGGVYWQNPVTVVIERSIIAGNFDTASDRPDLYKNTGSLTATGPSLIGVNTSVETTFPANLPLVGTTAAPANPKLSPLGYFGGPTQTMHPLIGSPAIDAGGTTNPGGTDQRGFPRFVDGDNSGVAQLDLGAVEAGSLLRVGNDPDGEVLRAYLAFLANNKGARIGFTSAYPAASIVLNGTELAVTAGSNLFIDASDLSGPVTISGNHASRVLNIASGATVAMQNLRIINGRTVLGGGIGNFGTLTLNQSTLSSNSADIGGGGIYNTGTLTLNQSTLSSNSADNGGGIYNFGTLTLNQSTFSGNSANLGGGIYNGGTLTLNQNTLSGNSAAGGGGIFNFATLTLNQSTLSGNSALFGGCVYNNGTLTLNQSTLSGNSAESFGGGIYSTATLTLTNSIVAGNMAPSSPNTFGSFTQAGMNLIDVDAKLAPLGNYGGPTQTIALLPGSPAINAATGSNAFTDQRGFSLVGVADIGATEYQGNPDLRRVWTTDGDGDGIPYGVEQALGTDPATSDRGNPRNLTVPVFYAQGEATLTFGRNTAAAPGTIWRLTRSTDLLGFSELFRFDGTNINGAADTSVSLSATEIIITDYDPPSPKAFYRFEAIAPTAP